MAPLLPPTSTDYNIALSKANVLRAIPDDNLLCAKIMLDKSSIDQFKELTYVLVREYKAIDGAYSQSDIRKDTMEKEMDKKLKDQDLHIAELSQNIKRLTTH